MSSNTGTKSTAFGATSIIHRAQNVARKLVGLCLVACAAVVLTGCSTLRLAYNQAPNLGYWWIDGFVDLSDRQSAPLRQDIDTFLAWHRSQELPRYAERLQQWQGMAAKDITADQACGEFGVLRAAYLRAVQQSTPALTQLAITLQPKQLDHLQQHHNKSNTKFAKEWLKGTPKERLARQADKTEERYETLYGKLSSRQVDLIEEHLQRSVFDPEHLQAERLRRQADLLSAIAQAQNQPAQAEATLRAWHDRVMRSPNAAYASENEARIREGCEQFAAVHNTTSAEQRTHALRVLKSYEADVRALIKGS